VSDAGSLAEGTGSGRAVYQRLLGYVKPYWRMFVLSIAGMLVFAATEPVFAAMIKPLLDGSFVERDPNVVRLMPILLVAVFLVRGIAGFVNNYCLKWVGRRVVADLRQEMFDHLLRAPTRYYDAHGTGQLLAKLTYNVENVATAATFWARIAIRLVPLAVAAGRPKKISNGRVNSDPPPARTLTAPTGVWTARWAARTQAPGKRPGTACLAFVAAKAWRPSRHADPSDCPRVPPRAPITPWPCRCCAAGPSPPS